MCIHASKRIMTEHDAIEAAVEQFAEFNSLWHLITSSQSLQIDLIVLIVGLIGVAVAYRKFSAWISDHRISYFRPHLSRFIGILVLPLFAITLISVTNAYIQLFDLFDGEGMTAVESEANMMAVATFARILNSINVLVIGYAVAYLIPIILTKREKSTLERSDFESWYEMHGFSDDDGDLFHKIYKWNPPHRAPSELGDEKFRELLKTEEGIRQLESFHTSKGVSIGSYTKLKDNAFELWKESERAKYAKYFEECISGDNESGRKLKTGQDPEEIYPIDTWREERRLGGFVRILPGYRPPGYAHKMRKDLPKSVTQILPLGIFMGVVLGVIGSWGVDLLVLATATGGFSIGLGLALQETMQNWFAYITIRKDKIVTEGERVKLESGYNGYVHKITSRVTYIRDALSESFAVIPTRQLINAQIINYTKERKMVPAIVDVGVSYLNNPRGVTAILIKVGRRAMKEIVDTTGAHLILHNKCPHIDENRPSCGCDKVLVGDINHPVVRFNAFNDSSLDFSMWVYVRDYGAQFRVKTEIRMIMYEEFKKYDIRIPWPIRTIYNSDEKQEEEEIAKLKKKRQQVREEYGYGDLNADGESE